ncbi:hypothetical protein ABS858_04580 [Vibrio neptunius]|uniref:hypothetical protein n=1 Tax=Vibrio neptunius TaxID=170651 RepID=UPI003314E585
MAMEKREFEEQFDNVVLRPLLELGFKCKNKSIYYIDDEINISLIRLGGKMATPGGISHVLCFRHTYLPNLSGEVPDDFENDVFSYPLKLKPSEIRGIWGVKATYEPKNLSYDFERIEFKSKSRAILLKDLERLKKDILAFLKWAKSSNASKLPQQIRQNGEQAWIEGLWLRVYESKIAI